MPLVAAGAVAPNWNDAFVAAVVAAAPNGAGVAANIDPVAGAADVVAPNAGGLKVAGAVAPNVDGAVPKPLVPAPNGDALVEGVVVGAPPNTKPPLPPPNPAGTTRRV